MTGGHDSLTWTQPDVMAETPLKKPRHVVLEMSSPDYVEKISRFFESSAGQSKQDTVSNEAAGAESDSGDSLFITQKPVPEAARSRRRRQHHPRSEPTSPRDFQESESDTSSSASHEESKTAQKRRTKYRLPKYNFPFLTGRKWKPQSTLLPVKQNTSLHNSTMGGFFKCVRELWQASQRGDDVESSLPTLDMEGDDISPLSEEERSEDEDIKVVERKCLVAPSKKAKRRRTWCSQSKQERRNAGNAREETSRGRQCELFDKTPAKASTWRATPLCLDAGSADKGESSCGGVVERERSNEPVTSDGHFLAEMQTPKTERHLTRINKKVLFEQKAREEELCNDSDATVCELEMLQRSPSKYTQNGGEATTAAEEPRLSQTRQTEDKPKSQNLLHSLPLLFSDSNNDSSCNETTVKKRKKKKKNRDQESVEEENDQSEDLHAVKSVNVEVEEPPSLSEGNRAEPVASQTSDELEFNGRTCMENSSHVETIVRQKERDKRKRSAADSVSEEVDGNLESDVKMEDAVFSVSCNGGRKKKKRIRSDEDVEQLQSSTAAEPLNDDAETQVKKTKRKKEETTVDAEQREEEEAANRADDLPPVSTGQLEESGNGLENTAASEETESSYVKRKKHKKKRQFSNHAAQDGGEGGDVSFSNDAATLEESTAVSQKKKKKALTEGADNPHTAEENEKVEDEYDTQKTKEGLEDQNAELVTKKKKKKNKKRSSRNVSEDGVTQSDDSVSVRKKEKKRTSSSFLVAVAEESDAQTHSEQKSASPSVQAHVWGAEKNVVSAGDAETESAEITGKLEEKVGERKKKRKRKMSVQQDGVEKDHEWDFEEANKTCQSALPETTDTSELVAPMERVESAADEDVALKKKKKKKKKSKDEPCRVIQESPQAAAEETESEKSSLNTCGLVSHKKKGKHRRSADVSHDSTSDLDTKKMLNMVEPASPSPETPGDQALNDIREKKKKKKKKKKSEYPDNILLEGKLLSKSAELEPEENKKKQRKKQSAVLSVLSSSPVSSGTSLSTSELSSSNKHTTVKRTLYNPRKDFLTDY